MIERLMRCIRDETGTSIGTKIGVVIVLASVVVVPWKFGIPAIKHMQLTSKVQSLVNWDMENRTAPLPDALMLDEVVARADQLGLPVKAKDVKISHPDERQVRIVVEYNYPYEFPGCAPIKMRRIDLVTTRGI